MTMNIIRKVGIASAALGMALVGLSNGAASATTECTVANFTVGGVFNQTGYLECLSPKLPTTGSDTNELLGVGIAIGVLGLSSVLVSRRSVAK